MMLSVSLLAALVSAGVTTAEDPESGLRSWTWARDGVSVQLVQLLPDQTRAFFLGRGFGPEEADLIGRACVFQTIFRNDGTQPVEYDLGSWSVHSGTAGRALRTREVWDREWEGGDVSNAARIALRWALLPASQHFEPGDYNWGMTSFGLPPGEQFSLSLAIRIGDKAVDGRIPSVVCAPDR